MLLHIQVKPNSKSDSIRSDTDGNLLVKIRAQPEDGKANKYLVAYLSEIFRLPKSKIEITKGIVSSHKTIKINAEETYIKNILRTLSLILLFS